ncbi:MULTISPECIES: DeoR/GlpR family DNA-binding transcription regulator [unclassified Lentimonas]|uniref:DeoR/GlpR family DNA-binding transcription regulator n=1 Tax=unclassified Lentimonas TaxID=2630993 RepID=UPI001327EEC3|nr:MULTISPECIES: DeoR/GlpR family DNA-binding transcription regulator [unclassified Lentimonas]CAA6679137.1 Transcriptional repressor of the fructose operon, DeoR family [Lentimonas sp. CC4]CAA6684119.1 Transcriptional repressor of the fructose operon, DeoR family [Lentimonas sp. CC6]CAA6694440.1 Transcriptional repressor of the fructose operon, DeoR family [Lentimonas sp. CC19]CAA6697084.1 Transcriptional repressor of the fructose operon, DeoR family [Lentimonas sp. CC10]CAA7069533.1 Transcri
MLAQERHQQILQLLEEQGTVRTVDLAEQFQCTDETIRRDLQILSDNNQLARVHGGASSLNGRPLLQSFAERRAQHVNRKQAIAKAALQLITPGRTYAFDSSTTAFELVSALPDLPYRVVTNAFAVMEHIAHMGNVELISTGGRYHPKTQTFTRSDSYVTLQRHNINIAFISCIGLDNDRGASEGFEEQAGFKEILVQLAQEVVLMVDSSKFNTCSEYFFAELTDLTHIITDSEASPEYVEALRAQGCKVTIAE